MYHQATNHAHCFFYNFLQFFDLLFKHMKHTKEKTKKKITQIIIIWWNIITISPFCNAQ
jgi:hypothetical protein